MLPPNVGAVVVVPKVVPPNPSKLPPPDCALAVPATDSAAQTATVTTLVRIVVPLQAWHTLQGNDDARADAENWREFAQFATGSTNFGRNRIPAEDSPTALPIGDCGSQLTIASDD
jgi:hypothetical protein